jgi:hypothetical protein
MINILKGLEKTFQPLTILLTLVGSIAVCAAENLISTLNTMPYDLAGALLAYRRESMYGTFETIKGMSFALYKNIEGFVVVIPTDFTDSHCTPLK